MIAGYRSDPARSGVASGSVGERPDVAYRIGGAEPVIASPVLVGETGFVSDGAGELIAFDVSSGDVRWRSSIGESDSSVVVSADSVFSVSAAGIVRRHDPDTGDVAWEADLDGATRSSPLLFDGVLWVAVADELVAVDPSSGVRRTSITLQAQADSSPAASGDVIVIGTRSNMLAFVDVPSQAVEFVALVEPNEGTRTYADGVAATPAISEGAVYVGSTAGVLLSTSLAGRIRWQVDLGSPIYGAVAIGDGLGFVPTGAGRLIAFGLDDGEVQWTADLGDAAYSSPVLVGEIVLATAENGRLFAFDAESGAERWSLEVGEPGNYMASTPAVAGSLVVLGSNDGSIVAVETDR
jgi:outer membrane protein assembly factor BamB